MNWMLRALGVSVVVFSTFTQAIAQEKLYWTDPNLQVIKRSNVDGSNVETIISVPRDYAYLAASQSLGKIFFSVGAPTPQLWSADFNGGNQTLLATFDDANYTRGLTFSPSNSKLYWSSSHGYVAGNGKIRSANANGSSVTDILSLTERYPYGMALDGAGKMYWADTVDETRIERANLDGSSRQTIVSGSIGSPTQLSIDPAGGKLYWLDSEHGFVYRANLDGTSQQTIGTVSSNPPALDSGIVVDGTLGKVFWSDTQLDQIYSANLDGTNKVAIVTTGLSGPFSLALVTVPEPNLMVIFISTLASAAIWSISRRNGQMTRLARLMTLIRSAPQQ